MRSADVLWIQAFLYLVKLFSGLSSSSIKITEFSFFLDSYNTYKNSKLRMLANANIYLTIYLMFYLYKLCTCTEFLSAIQHSLLFQWRCAQLHLWQFPWGHGWYVCNGSQQWLEFFSGLFCKNISLVKQFTVKVCNAVYRCTFKASVVLLWVKDTLCYARIVFFFLKPIVIPLIIACPDVPCIDKESLTILCIFCFSVEI